MIVKFAAEKWKKKSTRACRRAFRQQTPDLHVTQTQWAVSRGTPHFIPQYYYGSPP